MSNTNKHQYRVLLFFIISFQVSNCLSQALNRSGELSAVERMGYPKNSRLLVIEAEDLGMAHSIDRATFEALEKGWVTSAGVLVPTPWFPEVARWAHAHPDADLGVQIDLNSDWTSCRWRPISNPKQESGLLDAVGFLPSTEVFVARHGEPGAIEAEAKAQIDLAIKGQLPITHLDNHMRVLMTTPKLFQIYWDLGEGYKLPLVLPSQKIKFEGVPGKVAGRIEFGGIDIELSGLPIDKILSITPGVRQEDWASAYERTLESLPPGVYLLVVHLGFKDSELEAMTWGHPNWGAQWRQNDLDVVSSERFRSFLKDKGFFLVNWRKLQQTQGADR